MLIQVGPVSIDSARGPSLDSLDRTTKASLAEKGLLGGLPGDEWTGWSGEISLSGRILPLHLGGLDALESLHRWCRTGTKVPVLRGDGAFLGWYAIESVRERHGTMSPMGVGYEATWDVALKRQARPDGASIDLMIGLVSKVLGSLVSAAASAVTRAASNLFG